MLNIQSSFELGASAEEETGDDALDRYAAEARPTMARGCRLGLCRARLNEVEALDAFSHIREEGGCAYTINPAVIES